LNLGGGKAVIIGDAKEDKTPEMMIRFGEFINSLSGKYITAEDVGTTTPDMDLIRVRLRLMSPEFRNLSAVRAILHL
jgi:leucine dehydrogenase